MLQWTDRERVILAALCQGKSNKEIANACRVSVATVKNYVKALMRKTGADNRTQVALVFIASLRTAHTTQTSIYNSNTKT